METTTSRRVAALRQQLAPQAEPEMEGLSLAPASVGDVQTQLRLMLEHDSHAERDKMKALLSQGSLFVP